MPALWKSVKSLRTWPIRSCRDREKISILSKYTSAHYHLNGETMTFIIRWKVPWALRNPYSVHMK